jgi:hypothetical protein
MRTAFPDVEVIPEDVIAEADEVMVRFTDRGAHQGGGMGGTRRPEPTGPWPSLVNGF